VKKVLSFIIGFTILLAPLAIAQDDTVVNMESKNPEKVLDISMLLDKSVTKPIGMTPLQISLNSGSTYKFLFEGDKGKGNFTVQASGGVQNWVLDPGNTLAHVAGIVFGSIGGAVFVGFLPSAIMEEDMTFYTASGVGLVTGILGLLAALRNRATAELVSPGM
jgi:hypothetical protein